jgi:hypothetical protein
LQQRVTLLGGSVEQRPQHVVHPPKNTMCTSPGSAGGIEPATFRV